MSTLNFYIVIHSVNSNIIIAISLVSPHLLNGRLSNIKCVLVLTTVPHFSSSAQLGRDFPYATVCVAFPARYLNVQQVWFDLQRTFTPLT